jgi:magnesium chelatase subunit I
VSRTKRGFLAINELPDPAERIQVGLPDVLEGRDVQIRGHKVRLPLDILCVASANPEDLGTEPEIVAQVAQLNRGRVFFAAPTHSAIESLPSSWRAEGSLHKGTPGGIGESSMAG